MGSMGFDQVALTRYPQVERIYHIAPRWQFVGHCRWRSCRADWLRGRRPSMHKLTPRARIVSAALSGADPTIMLTGPMPAARKALAKAGHDDGSDGSGGN
jgi:acetyl-CoA C-acetyltransferase